MSLFEKARRERKPGTRPARSNPLRKRKQSIRSLRKFITDSARVSQRSAIIRVHRRSLSWRAIMIRWDSELIRVSTKRSEVRAAKRRVAQFIYWMLARRLPQVLPAGFREKNNST